MRDTGEIPLLDKRRHRGLSAPRGAALPPSAATLIASVYSSAVLRGRRRRPAGRITNHRGGPTETGRSRTTTKSTSRPAVAPGHAIVAMYLFNNNLAVL
jgi:hypothetical protein